MIPFSKRPIARGACVRRATRNASIGSRIPTNTSSPSRISRAAAATINSLKVKPRAALSASVRARTLFHAPLLLDPLWLGDLNFVDELDVLGLRNRLFHVLRECFGTQQFASDAVRLVREFADMPIEFHIRNIERRLASGNVPVDLLDQLLALQMVELAIVLVHVAEVSFLMGLSFVVAAFQPPNVEPMRRARGIDAEEVVAYRNPLIDIFLDDGQRPDARLHDSLQSVMTRAQMERCFAQHRLHRLRERLEARIAQHGQLKFSVAIDEIGVGEEIEPIVDDLIKRAEQPLLFESAPLKHLLRFHFSAVAKMIDQQVAHLPAVPHFFRHHAAERFAVMLAWRMREEPALLFD